MPKIISKEDTLNGEASIIKYNHRDTFYLRIKRDGKRYTNVSLETADIKVARKNALSKYVEVSGEAPKTRTSKFRFALAVDEFLTHKAQQVQRGQIKESSLRSYEQRLNQRIVPFARLHGINSISDINKESFAGYSGHYLDVTEKGKWKSETQGLSASTINSDITTLTEMLSWLCERDILDPKKFGKIPRVKDRKNYRVESNPAFTPDEFRLFKDHLYQFDRAVDDEESKWKRRWFIHWVLFQYQSGCRPHEVRQIRLGDCKVEKRPDGKLKGIVNIRPTTKTGKRVLIMNGHTLRKVIYHLNKGLKIRNQQLKLKGKEDCPPAGKEDLLMMHPFSIRGSVYRTVYSDEHIRGWYNEILAAAKLDADSCGKKFTLYSLRSTHITHALLNGFGIRVIADNCGTSQTEIERTYYLLNNLLNIDSLGFHKETNETEAMDLGD